MSRIVRFTVKAARCYFGGALLSRGNEFTRPLDAPDLDALKADPRFTWTYSTAAGGPVAAARDRKTVSKEEADGRAVYRTVRGRIEANAKDVVDLPPETRAHFHRILGSSDVVRFEAVVFGPTARIVPSGTDRPGSSAEALLEELRTLTRGRPWADALVSDAARELAELADAERAVLAAIRAALTAETTEAEVEPGAEVEPRGGEDLDGDGDVDEVDDAIRAARDGVDALGEAGEKLRVAAAGLEEAAADPKKLDELVENIEDELEDRAAEEAAKLEGAKTGEEPTPTASAGASGGSEGDAAAAPAEGQAEALARLRVLLANDDDDTPAGELRALAARAGLDLPEEARRARSLPRVRELVKKLVDDVPPRTAADLLT